MSSPWSKTGRNEIDVTIEAWVLTVVYCPNNVRADVLTLFWTPCARIEKEVKFSFSPLSSIDQQRARSNEGRREIRSCPYLDTGLA